MWMDSPPNIGQVVLNVGGTASNLTVFGLRTSSGTNDFRGALTLATYPSGANTAEVVTVQYLTDHPGATASLQAVTDVGNATTNPISIGTGNVATGLYSFAQGINCQAIGPYSHAEGNSSTASAESAHAEGYLCIADAPYSHAEGYLSRAAGYQSHAEGYGCTNYANAQSAYVGGHQSLVYEQYGYAHGILCVASNSGSYAIGALADSTNTLAYVWASGGSRYGSHGDYSYSINAPGGIWHESYMISSNGYLFSAGSLVATKSQLDVVQGGVNSLSNSVANLITNSFPLVFQYMGIATNDTNNIAWMLNTTTNTWSITNVAWRCSFGNGVGCVVTNNAPDANYAYNVLNAGLTLVGGTAQSNRALSVTVPPGVWVGAMVTNGTVTNAVFVLGVHD
jgi:hypothetical protein